MRVLKQHFWFIFLIFCQIIVLRFFHNEYYTGSPLCEESAFGISPIQPRSATLLEHVQQVAGIAPLLLPPIRHAAACLESKRFDSSSCMHIGGNIFPRVVALHNSVYDCQRGAANWTTASDVLKASKSGECTQELAFIDFFERHYPFTVNRHIVDEGSSRQNISDFFEDGGIQGSMPRVFLPMCGFIDSSAPPKYARNPKRMFRTWKRAGPTIERIQQYIHPRRIFYVTVHPQSGDFAWAEPLQNARTLRIDQTSMGAFGDIMIPIGLQSRLCDYERWDVAKSGVDKKVTIFSCGKEHTWGARYKGLRATFPRLLDELNASDVDASPERTPHDYENGFGSSKFCLLVPGDTTQSSQLPRSIMAGCVPIFMAYDFRELPFSNILDYKSFGLLIFPSSLLQPGAVASLYRDLHEMIRNGTYARMSESVANVRDFFNYYKTGPKSPYGATLLSMAVDEWNHDAIF